MRIARLENAASELYSHYAKIFSDIPEAASQFEELSRQEIAHRDRVLFHKRLYDSSKEERVVEEVDPDLVDAAVASIDDHISQGVFQLTEALEFALSLEENAGEAQYRKVVAGADPRLGRLMEALDHEDEAHIGRLRRLLKEYEGRRTL